MNFLDLLFIDEQTIGNLDQWLTETSILIESGKSLRSRGISSIDRITSICNYHQSKNIGDAIQLMKYGRRKNFADDFAQLIVNTVIGFPQDAVLCPVPLHWSRKFKRGFNQSELLVKKIAEKTDLKSADLLKRKRSTGYQSHRKRKPRLESLKDVFLFTGSQKPRHVVLVDDISTTGATLNECAVTLKKNGVDQVEGLVIARG